MAHEDYSFQTKLLHNKYKWDETTGGLSVPIQNASTFHQFDVDAFGTYDYARSHNPTRHALEETIAELEGGVRGFAFASGMAAISTALFLLSAGDHLVVTEDVYGGTYRVVTEVLTRMGIEHTFVDMTNLTEVRNAIQANTKAFYLETPSNPTLKVTDIEAVAAIAKEIDALVYMDNTFLTPALQRPLALGADIVLHSATKFLGGHSDVIAGLAVVKDSALGSRLKFLHNAFGSVLGPHDSWLVMRGIKTLHVRLQASSESAKKIADYLRSHPKIKRVYYPEIGAVLSFELENYEALKTFHQHIQIPAFAVSLGGVESILSYPATMSHGAMPKAAREKRGITDSLLRLSVGLEHVDDLIADLAQALAK
ncbi:MAG: aminotransferase class I/II-fold pyridoxal phosphate-dependent enzyme [Defluviitaleaceae bacterium]|nr:aminotransferase class I/II-fold pyridoxal phosphate-dependent enzyme [Defluviitaleaceae bacterium]